jgi:hypothetical protein
MILAAGIHDGVLAEAYHADPCEAPSMAAHDAHTLLTRSPRHAWHEHPRLNPDHEPGEPTQEQEEGTALHALLLERNHIVEPIEVTDWRTKAAQDARKAARAVGRIPLRTQRWLTLRETAGAMREQLAKHEIGDFLSRPGRPEVTMLWQDEAESGPIWCRSRTDWLCDDLPVLVDLKTVGGAASAWDRSVSKDGIPLRAAHYLRGARACGIQRARYLFVVLERDPPFGVMVYELSPALLTIGEEQHTVARNLWGACLADGDWPSYPPLLATVEADNSTIYRHEDWKERAQQLRQRKPRPFAEAGGHRVVNSEQPFA